MEEYNSKKDLDLVVQTFTGEDGGAAFAILRSAIDDIYRAAAMGDKSAIELRRVICTFSRLCDLALQDKFKHLRKG
jgi:hypothetical protein